jgi:amino acid transporter
MISLGVKKSDEENVTQIITIIFIIIVIIITIFILRQGLTMYYMLTLNSQSSHFNPSRAGIIPCVTLTDLLK